MIKKRLLLGLLAAASAGILVAQNVQESWNAAKIASTPVAGGASYDAASDQFSLSSSGEGLWGKADAFEFVSQTVSAGDIQITARLLDQQEDDPWAKAGLMLRQSVDPGALYAFAFTTPFNGIDFQTRLTELGMPRFQLMGAGAVPKWLRLVHSGQYVIGYRSEDGMTWDRASAEWLPLCGPYLVGLASTNRDGISLPSGAMLSYGLNDGAGTAVSDRSGNGKAGVLNGAASWGAGKIGGAVCLDGSSGYVSVPAGIVSSATNVTIAAWVNWNGGNNWQRIFDFGSGTGTYMFLSPKSGSSTFRFAIKSAASGNVEQQINAPALPVGVWKHVAVTISGGTGTLYVDGVQVAQNTAMTAAPASLGASTQNWIGRSQFSSDAYFKGLVDEFQIFNRALSASEIVSLVSNSQIAYYRFAETSGTMAQDSSGNGWAGTLNGGVSWTGNGVDMSGTNGYVALPVGIVSGLGDFSVSAWVKWYGGGNWQRIFDFGSGTGAYMFLSPSSGSKTLRFGCKPSASASEQHVDAAVLPVGAWKHVAITKQGNTARLYVDGVQAAQNTSMAGAPKDLGATTQNWIGRSQFATDPYFNGIINEFRIYNRVLNDSEVAQMGAGGSPAGAFRFAPPAFSSTSGTVGLGGSVFDNVQVTAVPAVSFGALPSAWTAEGVGTSTAPVYAAYDSNGGTFVLTGSACVASGTADSMAYIHRTWYGDGEFVVRVADIPNTSGSAQAGISLRADTTAEAAAANLFVTADGQATFSLRSVAGGSASVLGSVDVAAPTWLKLQRSGLCLNGYVSLDGTNWERVGSATQTLNNVLASKAEVGLTFSAVTSQAQATGMFDHFSMNGVDNNGNGLPDAWEMAMFGNLSQTAEGDSDGDGLTNFQEFLNGTNPLVADATSNRPSAPAVTLVSKSTPGGLERDVWSNLSGYNVSDLTHSAAFSGTPTSVSYVTSAAAPVNSPSKFGQRLRGTITAPVTGPYTFWISADDSGELWLGSGESRFSKRKIASISTWTTAQNWDANPTQQSVCIPLQAGQKYWIEALGKDGGGENHLEVAWQYPGQVRQVIPGQYLNSPVPDSNDLNDNGLPDGWEVINGVTGGEYGDPDGDGLSNFEEYLYGTNPVVADNSFSGVVANWKFGEGIGSVAANCSGTGCGLTLNQGVDWSRGYDGNGAVTLDGSGGYLSTVASPAFAVGGTQAISAASWIRIPANTALDTNNRVYPVITFANGTTDSIGLSICGGAHSVDLALKSGTSTLAVSTFDRSVIADGAWHHVGFSVDGQGNAIMVFDGIQVASKTGISIPSANACRVLLGKDSIGHCFKGGMDDAIVERAALVASDFNALYNAGQENGGLPNWWKWKNCGTLEVDPAAQFSDGSVTNLSKYQADVSLVASGTAAQLTGTPGQVLWQRWYGDELLDTFIEDINRLSKYPANPTETRSIATFEIAPGDGKINTDNRLRAYVIPPKTGAYYFHFTGEEVASLSLSFSGKSYERQVICSGSTWTCAGTVQVWTKNSEAYYLKAGQPYYLELIVKSDRFPGFGQVTWTTAENSTPVLIPSECLVSMGTEDDSNDVGMSDDWQKTWLGGLGQWPNQDPDFDGLTNLQEFQLGTNPLQSDTGTTGTMDAGRAAGHITYDYWINIPGSSVDDFVNGERYAAQPDGRAIIDNIGEPSLLSSQYAAVLRGYFVPAISGTYGFKAKAGSDGLAAYLSSDETPAQKSLLFNAPNTPVCRSLLAGHRYYFEMIHKVDAGTDAASLQLLQPGFSVYTDADPSLFVPLNAAGISPQAPLPTPWQRGDVFVNRGWLAYPGLSSMKNGTLEILAAGWSVYGHSDGFHWVYQELPDGGQIQARVLGCDFLSSLRTAGVMIRKNLGSGSPEAMLRTSGSNAVFTCRLLQDGYAKDDSSMPVSGPVWMRMVRKGASVYAYTSQDGVTWALFDQANLNLTGNAYVGVFASSQSETQICRATFDNISASVNTDFAASASTLDSDGDGYSDYEETSFLHSDPNANDLQPPVTVDSLAGSAGSSAVGSWSCDGGAIYNISVRGAVDYKITAPKDGIYRLAIQGAPRVNTISDTIWKVLVAVDGQPLETVTYELALGQSGVAYVYTPWLKAGTHTVRLDLDNVSIYRSFAFTEVTLQEIDGSDANGNGIPDWMENRLAAENGMDNVAALSRTSPFCLEGTARYQANASLTVSGTSVEMLQAIADGWYANVPLNSSTSVTVTAQFENGGKVDQKTVSWLATNVLNSGVPNDTLKIRKGDALLLAAAPAGTTSGSAAIAVTKDGTSVENLQVTGTEKIQYAFTAPGTYTLAGVYQDGTNAAVSGTLTVQVADAAFAKPDPFLSLGYSRDWACPQLPADAVVQSDSRMQVTELAPPAAGGRAFRLYTAETAKHTLLARLNDGSNSGPILDRALITGVEVSSGAQTGIYLVEQYPDGSCLVEMRLILSDFPEGFRAKLSIFAAGITFEDGTLEKWVTAADFDAQGQLKVRFIMAPNSHTSVCHRLYIYQGDTLLESRVN